MARVYVSVGSNIEPAENIRSAIKVFRQHYPRFEVSNVYESEAVGFEGDNFYNFVIGFDTEEDVNTVARVLRDIEDSHARDRSGPRFSARTIDLDLLLYDDLIAQELNIPRDEITKNAFVLQPLAELAPATLHPCLGQSFAALWRAFDKSRQRLWRVAFVWR
ncbi:MAG TPA: 2-amino-4-hydroxy-6-hydroxymethyldihydropteridine diphosphokinase [Candidatus Tenderia sp.]|nr:2-amino-4-hydroxy-6-hydroxymethyldihydropteridine diphosphokinase [Candidatus Tenderia sp.]